MIDWNLYVDFDGDGSFATSGDDISAYWVSHSITAGIQDEMQRVANAGRCTVVLNNEDRQFSPEYASGAYYGKLLPGLDMKLDMVQDGGTAITLFRGVTSAWQPVSGYIDGPRTCTLECVDKFAQLQSASIAMPLQEDETPKRVIEKVLATAFDGATATGTLTFIDTPADDDTVTIGDNVYTFKTALTSPAVANEVLIEATSDPGFTIDHAAENLAKAINQDSGAGGDYGTGTTRHAYVIASSYNTISIPVANQDTQFNLRETGGYDGLAVSFEPTDAPVVANYVMLYLNKVGSPTGTLTLQIQYANGSSYPTGTICNANATSSVTEASLGTSLGWVTFTLAGPVTFYPDMYYSLVLTTDRLASGTDYVQWGADADSYLGATLTGTTWYSNFMYDEGGMIFCIPGIVSLTANVPGTWGNALALAETGDAVTVSDATLTGGTDEPSGLTSLETGMSTLVLAGDTWRDGQTNALTALSDVVYSEWGLAWCARDGKITVVDRDYEFAQVATASGLTLNDQMNQMQGAISLEAVHNEVTVDYTARIEETTGVIARSNSAIEVKPGLDSTTVKLPFIENDTGEITGAKNAIVPVASTDYTVTDFTPSYGEDYYGFDYTNTGRVTIKMVATASGVDLTFSNDAIGPLFVHDLQVRGTVLVRHNTKQLTTSDATSITAYEKRSKAISLPFPTEDGEVLAQSIAAHLLARYKDPQYRLTSIGFRNQESVGGVSLYSVDIGENITVSEAQTAVSDKKCMVQGWQHSASVNPRAHSITFNVRELGAASYWILGDATYGVLGTTTRLGLGGGNYTGAYANGNVVGAVDFNRALRDEVGELFYQGPTRYIHYHDESIVVAGNALTTTLNSSMVLGHYAYQNVAATGDTTTFSCVLAPGRYRMRFSDHWHPNGGIFDVVMDDATYITRSYDTYAYMDVWNVRNSAYFMVEALARYKFALVTTGKRAASGGYEIHLTYITIQPASINVGA